MSLSNLSRLCEREESSLSDDFREMLSFVDKLSELSLDDAFYGDSIQLMNFRPDDPKAYKKHTTLWMNAPQKRDGCILVPKVKGV